MVLFFLDDLSTGGALGNLLAIVSGMALAWMVLGLRKQKLASPVDSVTLGNILTCVICLPAIIGAEAPDASSILGLLLLGVFQLGISYAMYSTAIKHTSALDAILIPIIEPLLNPIWVLLLLGERPGRWALIGGSVIILVLVGRPFVQKKSKIAQFTV
jgi:drug/metabolite transporter (DMT)-like permease